jgi:oxalate decarboxylase/phosphoglucose isomerase-like protein (cupin superfamily)
VVPGSPSLSSEDAELYELNDGRPSLRPGVKAEHVGARRVAELAAVTAVEANRDTHGIQYWTFSGVTRAHEQLPPELSYDLTFISSQPLGWERPKTRGHAHAEPELYEVLEGAAAFLIQDLQLGPAAEFVVLVEAEQNQCVAIPPFAQHITSNLGGSMLVVADVIAKGAQHDYAPLTDACGGAYYQRVDGDVIENPSYRRVPPLIRISAADWSDAANDGPIYRRLVDRPGDFAWLTHANGFAHRFPMLAHRLANVSLSPKQLTETLSART